MLKVCVDVCIGWGWRRAVGLGTYLLDEYLRQELWQWWKGQMHVAVDALALHTYVLGATERVNNERKASICHFYVPSPVSVSSTSLVERLR